MYRGCIMDRKRTNLDTLLAERQKPRRLASELLEPIHQYIEEQRLHNPDYEPILRTLNFDHPSFELFLRATENVDPEQKMRYVYVRKLLDILPQYFQEIGKEVGTLGEMALHFEAELGKLPKPKPGDTKEAVRDQMAYPIAQGMYRDLVVLCRDFTSKLDQLMRNKN